jgi:hypothetical protein
MMQRPYLQYVFAISMFGAGVPCLADPPPSGDSQPAAPETPAPASSTSAAPPAAAAASTAAPSGPSPEFLKKARSAGYKPETKSGVTQYCSSKAAEIGTHFETKRCYSESQLVSVLNAEQDQRDHLYKPQTCAGNGCSSH